MKINKNLTRTTTLICIFALILSVFSACTARPEKKTSTAFGNILSAEIYAEEEGEADEIFALITEAVSTAERELSADSEDGEIFQLNRDKIVYASDALREEIADAIIVCTALRDRVDISTGRISDLWGFSTGSPRVPESTELKKALDDKSMDKITVALDSNKITIAPEIEIDMSALREGIAFDRAYEATKLLDTPYILTAGDTVMAYGRHPEKDSWKVNIPNPFSVQGEALAEISVGINIPARSVFVSSSGIYENSFTENGKTYHGKLNPATGLPAESDLASVTVVASSGLNANALSDAAFVDGFKESTLSSLENFGAEAVFIFKDKTYYVTEGLKDSFRISDPSFTEHTAEPESEGFIK